MTQKRSEDSDKIQKTNKAVFLDRDGTLIVDKKYSFNPDEIKILPGVIEGLRLLQEAGFLLIIISNQSGIARGIFTEDELKLFNNHLAAMFLDNNVVITDIFCCPHHPNGVVSKYSLVCNCRKPQTGLFWSAVRKYRIDLDRSFAVGDRLRDCAICFESKCSGIIVSDHLSNNIDIKDLDRIVRCSSFIEGVDYILR
mgnify:FL=1|jgi:D-glycero-D-manno-heptose 1,7-bisphosphate phosphatase